MLLKLSFHEMLTAANKMPLLSLKFTSMMNPSPRPIFNKPILFKFSCKKFLARSGF